MITLKLCLEESGLRAEVELVDDTFDRIAPRVKHTLQVMHDAMEFQRRYQNKGEIIEQQDRKKIALVREGAGNDDAGPGGQREGDFESPAGV